MDKQTFTLTFGNCAENHRNMQIIGNKLDKGLSKEDLLEAKSWFEERKCECELVHLNTYLSSDIKTEDAYLLVVKKGLNAIVDSDKLYQEQEKLEKDKKAFMYGRVVNKHARHNLCFSDFEQEPDYENKKGRVYDFKDLPLLNEVREKIGDTMKSEKVKNLQCEGNYYYDVKKTYIGWHGDTEREIVVAIRLGADFPIWFRWYKEGEEVGKIFKYVLEHGDIYFMSDKAVGHDWKKKSKYTLRHAAGFEKALKM